MVNIFKEVHPRNPVLVAAWPGMGQVALYAARYLKDKLKAKLFAKLDGRNFYYQNDIVVRDGVLELQDYPLGKFYYWENKTGEQDIIIFLSDMQPQAEKLEAYVQQILDFSSALQVKMIFTFAAMVTSVEYPRFPKVRLAVTNPEWISYFQKDDLKILKTGQISGLNGFLLGMAKKRGIPGACLLGKIPFYSTQIENPRTSHAILDAFLRAMGITLDLSELSMAARKMEEELGKLMDVVYRMPKEEDLDRTQELAPISGDDIDRIKQLLTAQVSLPDSVKRRIEELFHAAAVDIARAADLKRILDEWHIYKDYEDRFLELFKMEDKKDRAC